MGVNTSEVAAVLFAVSPSVEFRLLESFSDVMLSVASGLSLSAIMSSLPDLSVPFCSIPCHNHDNFTIYELINNKSVPQRNVMNIYLTDPLFTQHINKPLLT